MVATTVFIVDRDAQDVEWFKSLGRFREWNQRALWAVFAHLGCPKSLVDFGCGDGAMVDAARGGGRILALGVEVLPAVRRFDSGAVVRDLREPIDLGRTFDMALCIETGEHMPPESAAALVDNIVRHTDHWLVFTAAAVGQGGDGHINCQPQEYLRALIEGHERGLVYVDDVTERLRETWRWATGPMFWLPQNVQVFERTQRVQEVSDGAS